MHVEFLVEEESCAECLKTLAPQLLHLDDTFRIHPFAGKPDLLKSLPDRLSGYASWLPPDWKIVVLVDRDQDECLALKSRMEACAQKAGLRTPSKSPDKSRFQVLNRIAIEELESWFFGDALALARAYPRIPRTLAEKRKYRNSDAITGGTWESLERVLQAAGYYPAGIPKIEVARNVSRHMIPDRNRSPSFKTFRDTIKGMRV
jgi:hypothetical protein